MPMPRTPVAKAKAKGADVIHPGRHRNRKPPKSRKLGAASRHLTEKQCEVWEAFKQEISWLEEADRAVVEIACVLRAKMISDPEGIGITALDKLRQCLGVMGATPADRSKITAPDDSDAGDPAEDYLQ